MISQLYFTEFNILLQNTTPFLQDNREANFQNTETDLLKNKIEHCEQSLIS